MRKVMCILTMCLVLCGSAWAQKTVTGRVTGEDGQPIPGVSVVQKGSVIGTITDVDGKYTFRASAEDITLIFSFVGMRTLEVPVTQADV